MKTNQMMVKLKFSVNDYATTVTVVVEVSTMMIKNSKKGHGVQCNIII